MPTPFQKLLSNYRVASKTKREQGNYFEKLVISFLQNDERFLSQFTKIQTWAIETMNNPRYPLELLQRVITVSLETVKIVNKLPKLDI